MSRKRILSGIQPSGNLTIGNYLGAIQQFVALDQAGEECFYCIVDLHAITVPQDPVKLKEKTLEVAGLYIASGVDPTRSTIFIQSHVRQHSELAWFLQCISRMGELSRMTQFKDKGKGQESAGVGLFTYPVLQAADILIYHATHVPVGEDQKQHIELTRDLAQRFNSQFGETFTIPEPLIAEVGARIMALDDPSKKMSKSSPVEGSRISLLDPLESIKKKIMRAVTDTDNEIRYDEEKKPGISNLLTIYSLFAKKSIPDLEREYEGKQYGTFKKDLVEVVTEAIRTIQNNYYGLSQEELLRHLRNGAERASAIAEKTVREVKEKMGFVL
jgi:tryptophanyl-tRNA synthetase